MAWRAACMRRVFKVAAGTQQSVRVHIFVRFAAGDIASEVGNGGKFDKMIAMAKATSAELMDLLANLRLHLPARVRLILHCDVTNSAAGVHLP